MPRGANWIAVMTAYIVKGWTLEQCAKEFGLNPTTVRTRAAKEGWKFQRDNATTSATGIATKEATDLVNLAIADLRVQHAQTIAGMKALLVGAAEDIQACKPGRSRAETRRACFEAFKTAAHLERLALGFSEGQSSIANEDDDGKQRVVFVGADQEQESA